ncbi:phosphosulfolactate synthase [Candidatus Gracilibacteria bacterium]|nr:phosphosulfolactate synthase [Candidatus Gracilibacteria bacterium]
MYIGGGVVDAAFNVKNGIKTLTKILLKGGIGTIEFSNSSDQFNNYDDLKSTMDQFKNDFNEVIIEIGTKEKDDYSVSYVPWEKALNSAIKSGADRIIIEGGGGDVGIYDEKSHLKLMLLVHLLKICSDSDYDYSKLIFETMRRKHQAVLMKIMGKDVSLGNIPLEDVDFINKGKNYFKGDTPQYLRLLNEYNEIMNQSRNGGLSLDFNKLLMLGYQEY